MWTQLFHIVQYKSRQFKILIVLGILKLVDIVMENGNLFKTMVMIMKGDRIERPCGGGTPTGCGGCGATGDGGCGAPSCLGD